MTKKQIVYYVVALAFITLSVYLYTSNDAQAPDSSVPENSDNYVSTENDSSSTITSTPTTETSTVDTERTATDFVEPTTNGIAYTLTNTNWRWLRTENATGTIITKPKSTAPFVLKLDDKSSMSSQTDCNTVGGSYTIVGNKLNFGALMSTLMYCENSQESEYTNQLSQVENYEIIDNTLRLNLQNSAGTMFFLRVD